MQVEWINPFISSTISTIETMVGCEITRGKASLKVGNQPNFEVSGIMSLEGKASGIVVVSIGREFAIEATEQFLGTNTGQIDADVIDVVCEITNMIAGGANNQLEHLAMSIGLPSVVSGRNHVVSYPSGVATISVPFETSLGPLCIDASIKGADEAAATSQPETSCVEECGAAT